MRGLILVLALVAFCGVELLKADDEVESSSTSLLKLLSRKKNLQKQIELGPGLTKLNDYLTKHEKGDDIDANLQETADYWASQPRKLDPSFKQVLKLVSELESIPLCSERAIMILAEIDTGLDQPLQRIDDLLYKLSKKIHHDCRDTYLEVMKSKYEQMDQSKLELVKTLIDGAYANYGGKSADEILYRPEVILFDSTYLKERMIDMGRKDPEGPLSHYMNAIGNDVPVQVFGRALYEYLVEPCKEHNKDIGRYLFEPIFDRDSQLNFESDLEHKEFYMKYVRFRVCHFLIKGSERNTPYDNPNAVLF